MAKERQSNKTSPKKTTAEGSVTPRSKGGRTGKKPQRTVRNRHAMWTLRRVLNTLLTVIFLLTLWSYVSPSTWRSFKSWIGISTTAGTSSGGYDGIDVSKHQGKIDWEKVAKDPNIKFVYIKATEGRTLVDKRYRTNIASARKAGMKVGSYHFFTSNRSARDQFDNFRRNVHHDQQDLIPMVDVEESGCRGASRAQLQESLGEFMQLVKKEYGKYPLLYSQYRFYNQLLAPEFNKYFIFIARYSSAEPVLHGGGKHNIWQYSERGKVDGIKGYVDLDRFVNGSSLRDISL